MKMKNILCNTEMASIREELIKKIKGESFCKSNKFLGQ